MSGKSVHLYQSGMGCEFFSLCVFHKVRDTAAWNAPIDFSFDLSSAFMQLYPLLHKTQMKNTPKNLPIISIAFLAFSLPWTSWHLNLTYTVCHKGEKVPRQMEF